jgi:tetratricopeptide (TPR) repeat protein
VPKALPPAAPRPQPGIPSQGAIPKAAAPSSPTATGQDQGWDEYLEVGALYAQKGRYQKAEALFKKVTQENPSSSQAHNNLGFAYLKQGKYEAAEREFKESLRIDPASVLPNYNLACLYSRKGQTEQALIYLNRALKKDARVKAWARSDEDFDKLRSDVVFQELIGAPAPKSTPREQKAVQKQEGSQKSVEPQKQAVPPKTVEPPKQVEPQEQEGTQEDAHGAPQGISGGTTK